MEQTNPTSTDCSAARKMRPDYIYKARVWPYYPCVEIIALAFRAWDQLQNSAPHLQGTEWPCSTIYRSIDIKICTATALRSEDQYLLNSPRWWLETFGKRAFSKAAPTLWNPLPLSVKQAPSIDSFKTRLKTYLFNKAYWLLMNTIKRF